MALNGTEPVRPVDDTETTTVDVSMVMVTYNAEDWTRKALGALEDGVQRHSYELIVIDNASTVLDKDDLRLWAGPAARISFLEQNIGFGRACNLAVSQARGRTVLLVNPDAVVDPGAVDELLDFLDEDPRRGIVGGRITDPNGDLDYGSCFGHQTTWSLLCFATGMSTAFSRSALLNPEGLGSWERDSVREVGIVTGCLLLADRGLWERLGGFDPAFFMYGEDADLCQRAWDAGFTPSVTPAAHAVHALGASSSSRVAKQILLFRGKVTLIRKSPSAAVRSLQSLLLTAGVGLRGLGEFVTRRRAAGWLELWQRRREWAQGW
ncbi:glycosyltransferase family 2 protein [Rhodococcus sp. BP-349]|uniref:glycosyltransferase family 2 protein n=1 Tax=unclassified Rhodococcus (in: high G+C Gram-positive bacteria) TaxID=192944 RepID=UPI001C9B6FD4|nr:MULTISPECIES: glycosyltransferase family 2 protein [unclassified Rhodococcus (in: high G+C Gram-positive bacteria)]MBY6539466.1 glycosyltransferase family 2 protein [Rhodococcus sp. BP-363]MBY6544206.1 glycosyltransferase family 2 protein [Rhodococcus sp. BP-369]MBY6563436.1 glycosyltransferase family 2 protein [Rhodococcus sp. BP-370]MBY6577728.1 glycosyltransferase family 2 protein [Rhodococcus sp. BP-364]MBY6587029.1 glycosyltransferase family 2 protein [Rhodococcus sp. BP-358]